VKRPGRFGFWFLVFFFLVPQRLPLLSRRAEPIKQFLSADVHADTSLYLIYRLLIGASFSLFGHHPCRSLVSHRSACSLLDQRLRCVTLVHTHRCAYVL
jgi:hypothetical protein